MPTMRELIGGPAVPNLVTAARWADLDTGLAGVLLTMLVLTFALKVVRVDV